MEALEYLLKKEWSMGNGQCPECGGVPESWFPHPLHATPDTLGHERNCPLAAGITDIGGTPLYLGESKLTGEYRWGLVDLTPETDNLFGSAFRMLPADEPVSEREQLFRDDMARCMREIEERMGL